MLKNGVFLGNLYIKKLKDKMGMYSKTWAKKKGFLEGAYKILLFRYVKIIDDKIKADTEQIHSRTKEMALTKNLIVFLLNLHLLEDKNVDVLEKLTTVDENGKQTFSLLKICPSKDEEYLIHLADDVKKELLL